MKHSRQNRARAAGGIARVIVLLLAAGVAGGCHYGVVQTAFYTDEQNRYPRAEFADNLLLLFKEPDHRYVNVEWQDVRFLRLSIESVEKNYYKMSALADPMGVRGGDRFHVKLECLVDPKQAATFTVRESRTGQHHLPGVGTIHVNIDETGYGTARLDRLVIDFDKMFLHALHRMVAGPAEREGNAWRFPRRRMVSDAVGEPVPVGKQDYTYTLEKSLDRRLAGEATVKVTVTTRRRLKHTRKIVYAERWEYWPVNPLTPGADPAVTKPLKTTDAPEAIVESRETFTLEQPSPAVGEIVQVRFLVPELDAAAKPDYLADTEVATGADGSATLNLRPFLKAAELPGKKIIVQFKAKDDPGNRWYSQEILRTELLPWYEAAMSGK